MLPQIQEVIVKKTLARNTSSSWTLSVSAEGKCCKALSSFGPSKVILNVQTCSWVPGILYIACGWRKFVQVLYRGSNIARPSVRPGSLYRAFDSVPIHFSCGDSSGPSQRPVLEQHPHMIFTLASVGDSTFSTFSGQGWPSLHERS